MYETMQVKLNNYWRGSWPQHPVQLHMHGLPEDVIVKVISDFVEEQQAPERAVKTYADWLLTSFGKTFSELFPMQYARKYHTTTADNMSTDWPARASTGRALKRCSEERSRLPRRPSIISPISAIPRRADLCRI